MEPVSSATSTAHDISTSSNEVKPQKPDATPKDTRVKIEEVEDEDPFLPRQNTDIVPGGESAKTEHIDAEVSMDDLEVEDIDSGDENTNYPGLEDHGNDQSYDEIKADFNNSDDELDFLNDPLLDNFPPVQPNPSAAPAGFMLPPPLPGSLSSATLGQPSSSHGQELKKDEDRDSEPQWKSAGQLTAFRETSVAIADDYLKQQKIKLGKGRKLPGVSVKDRKEREIYNQGREDAKKIDVKRRRLKHKEDNY